MMSHSTVWGDVNIESNKAKRHLVFYSLAPMSVSSAYTVEILIWQQKRQFIQLSFEFFLSNNPRILNDDKRTD